MIIPTREQSLGWLSWAEELNPGPWTGHVRSAARAAEAIAGPCGMNAEAAWHMGLLHDIGYYNGRSNLKHAVLGYDFLMERGYPDLARICLTHSFSSGAATEYSGTYDIDQTEIELIKAALPHVNDYDRLIQLCDAICVPEGVCLMEKRLMDVAIRHGSPPPGIVKKWKAYFDIKAQFEAMLGHSIYRLFDDAIKNTFE